MDSTLGPQTLKIDFGTLEKGKATFSANGYIAEYPAIVSHVNGARKHW